MSLCVCVVCVCHVCVVCVCHVCVGANVPPHATLLFDLVLEDLHNSKDDVTVETLALPQSCARRSVSGDYIRYHYNGTFLNGHAFDSRYS